MNSMPILSKAERQLFQSKITANQALNQHLPEVGLQPRLSAKVHILNSRSLPAFVLPILPLWVHMRGHGNSEWVFTNGKTASSLEVVTGGFKDTHSLSHWFPRVLQLAKDSSVPPGHVVPMGSFSPFSGRHGGGEGREESLSGGTKEKDWKPFLFNH